MYRRYTSEQLKKLAMGTMFIDHAAVALIYNCGLGEVSPFFETLGKAMRLIGRMAFPLYAFLLVQGFLYTRDWKKYVARVAMFAVISELPYNLVVGKKFLYPAEQNTMFTMAVGLLCMKMVSDLEKFERSSGNSWRTGRGNTSQLMHVGRKWFHWFGTVMVAGVGITVAEVWHMDYGMYGILLLMVFYEFRFRPVEQLMGGCVVLLLMYQNYYAFAAWIAIFLISRYNGERGRKMGYLPYIFYPAHLLVLAVAGMTLQ